MAQSVKHPTFEFRFGHGHGLTVGGLKPPCCTDSMEPAWNSLSQVISGFFFFFHGCLSHLLDYKSLGGKEPYLHLLTVVPLAPSMVPGFL